jgi:uncharacterized protein (DUF983 family)
MTFIKNLFRFIYRELHPKCPACKDGRLFQEGEHFTGRVWLNIYVCDKCKNEYV